MKRLGEWQFGDQTLTADLMDNGKVAVRAGERMVTAPLAESETSREFTAFGRTLAIRRRDGEVSIEEAAPLVPSMANPSSVTAPTAILFIAAGVVLLLLAGGFLANTMARRGHQKLVAIAAQDNSNPFAQQALSNFDRMLSAGVSGAVMEMLDAALLMAAGLAVLARRRWSSWLLVVSAWGVLVPLVIMFARLDRLAHLAVFEITTPPEALASLRSIHRMELLILSFACIGVGLLLSAARRKKVAEAIESSYGTV